MYDEILLPTDGSEGVQAAVDHALYVADLADAMVHALFVVDERGAAGEWDVVVEREEEHGEAAVDAVATAGSERGVAVERHLRRGTPHEEILDAADAYDADLVVMGTHGRTGIDRFVNAGSVAERVVRHASVPVMTARLGEGRTEPTG